MVLVDRKHLTELCSRPLRICFFREDVRRTRLVFGRYGLEFLICFGVLNTLREFSEMKCSLKQIGDQGHLTDHARFGWRARRQSLRRSVLMRTQSFQVPSRRLPTSEIRG